MKIAIEAQRIFRTNKHGMDFVALESIRQLQKLDTENEYYILIGSGEDKCLSPTSNFKIIQFDAPGGYPVWEQILLPRELSKIKPDILHCTSNTAPLYVSSKLVVTLHDIIFLEDQQSENKSTYQNLGRYYRRMVVPRILPKCKKIITVSEFECNRIRQALHLAEDKIIAIYNGVNDYFQPIEHPQSVTRNYIAENEYIFFLGNTDPKKNTLRTLQGYANYVKRAEKPLPLLVADLKPDIINAYLKEGNIEWVLPYIHASGYIVNKDLPAIYSGAKIFLYTSLRESFGIPILEAMKCGTPVITSNTSAIPEIAGEGAVLVDPMNVEAIADALFKLDTDEAYYKLQIAYGVARAQLFSWENTARKLLDLYKSLM